VLYANELIRLSEAENILTPTSRLSKKECLLIRDLNKALDAFLKMMFKAKFYAGQGSANVIIDVYSVIGNP
jgi:hypothetical protein